MGNQRWGTRASCRDFSPGARLTFGAPVPTLRRQIKFQKAAFQKSNSRKQRSRNQIPESSLPELSAPLPTHHCSVINARRSPVRLLCVLLNPHALRAPWNSVPRGPRESHVQRGREGPWASTLRVLLCSCTGSINYLISLRRQNTGSKTELLRISRCW